MDTLLNEDLLPACVREDGFLLYEFLHYADEYPDSLWDLDEIAARRWIMAELKARENLTDFQAAIWDWLDWGEVETTTFH